MSITLSPKKAHYLERVRSQLSDLPEEEREEIVQDLEAHLTELDDSRIEAELGIPEAFAAEFRSSAGLDEPTLRPTWDALPRVWNRTVAEAQRLSQLVHWPAIRPVWIWTRGWLIISAWALLVDYQQFRRFPIPVIGGSSATGLILVVLATALSWWLEKRPQPRFHRVGSMMFSFIAGWALFGTLVNPIEPHSEMVVSDFYFDRMTTADGVAIDNIYAYDLEGNPVEVLLFDNEGRALLILPSYVYADAELAPSQPLDYGNGTVSFQRDGFGRIIPHLYPLQLTVYDDYGRVNPMPPPSLGFPTIDDDDQEVAPSTTITRAE